MTHLRRLIPVVAALVLAGCAGVAAVAPPAALLGEGWTPAAASTRPVGLGLPGGTRLEAGVEFAGGVEIVAAAASPLHSLSDFKLLGDAGFLSVSDAGDLVRGELRLDGAGRLSGLGGLAVRRLTLPDGGPIVEKADGDAEGLALPVDGGLLVSFERRHRIWNYGPPTRPLAHAIAATSPDFAFPSNDGMEAIAARAGGGWRVAGESGGVWDCALAGCVVVVAPPATPAPDSDYRITGMDRDPAGDGFFVIQRSYAPPVDARARVRRMAADGRLGPVLVELKLPGTTDNFEGIAAVARDGGVRLYVLSDDNDSATQRTLLLAFDVRPVPTP